MQRRRRHGESIDSYLINGNRINVLAEGRLVNLATMKGMGHPVEVMDLSFALQALCTEYMYKNGGDLTGGVYDVPYEIDATVAHLKLASLGITIDELSEEQKTYPAVLDSRHINTLFLGYTSEFSVGIGLTDGKEILLRIPGVGSEMLLRKAADALIFRRRKGLVRSADTIETVHDHPHPGIYRKGLILLEAKEQHAVRHLRPDAGVGHQCPACFLKGHLPDTVSPSGVRGDGGGSLMNVGGTVSKGAPTFFFEREGREGFRCGKGIPGRFRPVP